MPSPLTSDVANGTGTIKFVSNAQRTGSSTLITSAPQLTTTALLTMLLELALPASKDTSFPTVPVTVAIPSVNHHQKPELALAATLDTS